MIGLLPGMVMPSGHSSVDNLHLGVMIPVLAYTVSVLGSVVGLACTTQSAKAETERQRRRWLMYAALTIGGVAIWMMHFIAMLGMSIPGTTLRYNLPWTIGSAVLSIVATYVALRIIDREAKSVPQVLRLLAGGLTMGLAVNIMHYAGMHALRMQGSVSYDPALVAASVGIAVVAATVALWFTLVLRSPVTRVAAGFVMGVAVVGMHYTGMAAMQVTVNPNAGAPSGLDAFVFLFPVFVIGLLALAVPAAAVIMAADGPSAPRTEVAPEVLARGV